MLRFWLISACSVFLACVIWMAIEWSEPGLIFYEQSAALWQNANGFHALAGASLFMSAPFMALRIADTPKIELVGYFGIALALVTLAAAFWAAFAQSPSWVLTSEKPPAEILAIRSLSRAMFMYLPVAMLAVSWAAVLHHLGRNAVVLVPVIIAMLLIPANTGLPYDFAGFSPLSTFAGTQVIVTMSHAVWYGPPLVAWVALLCIWIQRGQAHWATSTALLVPAMCLALAFNRLARLGLQGMPSGYPDFPQAFAEGANSVSLFMIATVAGLLLTIAFAVYLRRRLARDETDVFL